MSSLWLLIWISAFRVYRIHRRADGVSQSATETLRTGPFEPPKKGDKGLKVYLLYMSQITDDITSEGVFLLLLSVF